MKSFVTLLVSAAIVVATSPTSIVCTLLRDFYALTYAVINGRAAKAPHRSFCEGAKTISNTSFAVGDGIVEVAQLSCGTPLTKRQTSTSNAFGDVCGCKPCCNCYVVLASVI